MTTVSTPVPRPATLVASRWHTASFVAFFLLLAAAGAMFQQGAQSHAGPVQQHPATSGLYLSLIAAEWALVWWVSRGLRHSGTTLRDLIGGRWRTWRDVAVDVVLAAATWTIWTAALMARDRWLAPDHAASIGALLPRQPSEIVLWIGLSMSAGFCEEVAFRGYLQQQFRAMTGSTAVAILMQAALFGISHGYQGVRATVSIASYAVLLGVVARWRRSLRPGMLVHAWSDVFSGLLAR